MICLGRTKRLRVCSSSMIKASIGSLVVAGKDASFYGRSRPRTTISWSLRKHVSAIEETFWRWTAPCFSLSAAAQMGSCQSGICLPA